MPAVVHFGPAPAGRGAEGQGSQNSPGLDERERAAERARVALAKAVDAAIDRGVESLLARQLRDGSWAPDVLDELPFREYRNGTTAFVCLALLKSGLSREHPAVRRGLVFLRQATPRSTYPLAAELLALAAGRDRRDAERAAVLLDALLDERDKKTRVWGYPGYPDVTTDLSNTQFAALGLRAAETLGLVVEERAWRDLLEGALAFQEAPRRVGDRELAGFTYVRQGDFVHRFEWARPTGSMTAAGVAILALCAEALGEELPRKLAEAGARGRELGLAFLAEHFSVRSNVNGDGGWIYYWLYGVERVGALCGVTELGGHRWYAEGAEYLIGLQEEDGTWSVRGERPTANTCFALLFLTRSTAAFTGGDAAAASALEHVPPDDDAEVRVRASGASPLVVWVAGFHSEVLARYAARAELVRGLRVVAVDWLVDDEVVASVPGDPDRAWDGARFAWRIPFERPGTFAVRAEARVVDDRAPGHVRRLRSDALEVTVLDVLEPWMLEYATASAASLIEPANVLRASASSVHGARGAGGAADDAERERGGDAGERSAGAGAAEGGARGPAHGPRRAFDRLQCTGWLCASGDETPRLALELRRPVKADALLLSPFASADRDLGEYAEIERVRVVVNGNEEAAVELDLHADEWRKTELRFPEPVTVRRLEITVLARGWGDRHGGAGGFAELELVRR